MAKLSKEARRFIVRARADESKFYSFREIKSLIKDKFGISVSETAVRKSYHKDKKEKEYYETPLVVETSNNIKLNQTLSSSKNNEPDDKSNIDVVDIEVPISHNKKDYDTSVTDNIAKKDLLNLFKG